MERFCSFTTGVFLFFLISNNASAQIVDLYGENHTCALFRNGKVKCWGPNPHGELGLGYRTSNASTAEEISRPARDWPYVNLATDEKVIDLSVSEFRSCAIFESGRAKCWGMGSGGLGLGDNINRGDTPESMLGDKIPFLNLGVNLKVFKIAHRYNHTCAILDNGKVKCWGFNDGGELGLGDDRSRGSAPGQMGDSLPYVNLGVTEKAIQIGVGLTHTCVLFESGKVKCWGQNRFGQLGLEDTVSRGTKANQMGENLPYLNFEKKVIQLSVGRLHSCVLLEDGIGKCWGRNDNGELGQGNKINYGSAPRQMSSNLPLINFGVNEKVIQVSAGWFYSCFLFESGRVKCMGHNSTGGLGVGDTLDRGSTPESMGMNLPFVNLGSNSMKATRLLSKVGCVMMEFLKLPKCWGFNQFGQFGLGNGEEYGTMPEQMGDNLPYIDLGT